MSNNANNAFEREKLSYGHNTAQMRALNEQMGKVPTMSITLTGGLWFAASQAPALEITIKFGLLLFAGIANIGLALSCYRIRDVMQSYLEKIQEFAPKHFADGVPKKPTLQKFSHYSMISVYAILMGSASIMSFIAAFFFYWPFHADSRWISFIALLVIVGVALAALTGRRPRLN